MIKGLANLAHNLQHAQRNGHSHFRQSYSNGYTANIASGVGYLCYYGACLLTISHKDITIHYKRWKGYSQSTTRALNTLKELYPSAIIE